MQTNSRWSGPPVREVVWEAVQRFTGGAVDVEFAIKDIEQVALEMYPDFKVSNIGAEITAGCVNSPSRHHYSPDIDRYWKVAYGVYRLYVPKLQGTWIRTLSHPSKTIMKVLKTLRQKTR